jgi:hypothetical protein
MTRIFRRIAKRLNQKPLTRKELLARRESILNNFTIGELENPVTMQSVREALENIDRALAKAKS